MTTEPSLFDPDAYADGCPHQLISRLREEAAVSWQPEAEDPSLGFSRVEAGWWVHRYDEVRDVLRRPDTFSSRRRTALLVDLDDGTVDAMSNMLLNMDPPDHSRYRRLVAAAFTPRRVAELEPRIRQMATAVVDAVAPLGRCDAVTEIAAPLPMTVIAELLGIPERREELFTISNQMVGAIAVDDPAERAERAAVAVIELQVLGQELAAQKRAQPDDSLLSAYVHGELDEFEGAGEGITDDEAGWFLLLLAVAGNETVRTATGQAIRLFAEHPDQRDLLVADLEARLPGAVEEVLRFRSPVRAIRRTTTRETEVDGQTIGTDAKVICHFSSALRDGRHFDEPDRFDITRPPPAHQLAFGYGEHYCLGANLARLQLRSILREVFGRIPDIHPAGPVVHQPTPLLEGLLSLPVAFSPERIEAPA